jgi:hypothetical protein
MARSGLVGERAAPSAHVVPKVLGWHGRMHRVREYRPRYRRPSPVATIEALAAYAYEAV